MVFVLLFLFGTIVRSYAMHCKGDPEFRHVFFERIDFVRKYQAGKVRDVSLLRYHIGAMERITGCKSRFYGGEIALYPSQRDMVQDIKFWKQWYRLHKCEMTIEAANEIW
jgi:hypothetical protein